MSALIRNFNIKLKFLFIWCITAPVAPGGTWLPIDGCSVSYHLKADISESCSLVLKGGECFRRPQKGEFKPTLLRRLEKADLKALGFRRDGLSRNPKF